jgi:CRP-like cAMP-binding protein
MKNILIIEDDLVMRENTQEMLELAGFNVEVAENGKIGVLSAKRALPDLIICDIMMPELDGYGVLHILSSAPQTSAIPFIFLSAKAEKSEMRKGMELGADDYLSKPFEESDLLAAIDARLTKSSSIRKSFLKLDEEGLSEDYSGIMKSLSDSKKNSLFKKKEIVFHEQDVAQFLFHIKSGKVKTYRTHSDGKEYITEIYSAGDFFGVNSLFDESPYSDTAISMEDSVIKKIPKVVFLEFLGRNRDLSAHFIKKLSNNIEQREQQLISMAYDTVRKRTASVLVSLEPKFKVQDIEHTEVKITREDLASLAGTAIETVIRCLRHLKSDGFIETSGRKIIILNLDGLKSIES